jgi:Zn finger protein HypA/HybF involved in hydrogenase expression
MINIVTAVIVIVILIIVFCIGYVLGAFFEYPEIEANQQELHCFQCEIEMPVKEKNGNLYCSNCGLRHTNYF